MRKTMFFVVALLAASLIMPAAGFAADKEIKIGVIYPLTGGAAAAGPGTAGRGRTGGPIANEAMPDIDMAMAKTPASRAWAAPRSS
jgi:branched-chain amino acid transport system substrate-binding protein